MVAGFSLPGVEVVELAHERTFLLRITDALALVLRFAAREASATAHLASHCCGHEVQWLPPGAELSKDTLFAEWEIELSQTSVEGGSWHCGKCCSATALPWHVGLRHQQLHLTTAARAEDQAALTAWLSLAMPPLPATLRAGELLEELDGAVTDHIASLIFAHEGADRL